MTTFHGLVIGVFLVGGTLSLNVPTNFCSSGGVPKEPLIDKMKFPADFKVEGTRTDWLANTTQYFTEISSKGQVAITVSDRTGSSRIVKFLPTGSAYSLNSSSCLQQKELHAMNLPAPILEAFALQDSTFSSLVEGIIAFSTKNNGFFNDSATVAGVEGVTWITCKNTSDFSYQAEVIYAADMSIKPASTLFDNPQMLFLRLSQFSHNDTSFASSISFSIDRRAAVTEKDQTDFEVPRGVVCDGWNAAPAPLNFSDPVNVVVTQGDGKSTYELFYSRTQNLSVVTTGGVKAGDAIPFYGTPAKEGSVFVHDYYTGYEYSLATGRCSDMTAIPEASAEASKEGEKIKMKDLAEVFFNKSLAWQDYGKVSGEAGNVFRAVNASGNVLELVRDEDKTTLRIYSKGVVTSNVSIVTLSSTAAPQTAASIRDCYARQLAPNGSFMFSIKNQPLSSVYRAGEEVVTSALSTALAALGPISPYRIKAFYTASTSNMVDVFFRVAEKSTVAPANTTTLYDHTTEVSVPDFIAKFNATMQGHDWKFYVPVAGKTEEFVANVLTQYPPPPAPAPYEGYTGGAMFVLGLFTLVFGCAIGAGALFFITKRQRISTLAYQVFE